MGSKARALLAIFIITLMMMGCATLSGLTPAEQVLAKQSALHAAMKAGDIETLMEMTAANYSNSQGYNKKTLRGFAEMMIAQGTFKTMTIDMANCKVAVEGDSATVKPVVYGSQAGVESYAYKWEKGADGIWRVVNHELTY